MLSADGASVITAVSTSLGAVAAVIAAWIAYRNHRSLEEEAAPDIGARTIRWRKFRGQLLLEVELYVRNQSHRSLFLHRVHFKKPRRVPVAQEKVWVYQTYHPKDFRPGPVADKRQLDSAGSISGGFRTGPSDRSDPEYYLLADSNTTEICCEVTYSLGTEQSRKRRTVFDAKVDADPTAATEIPLFEKELSRISDIQRSKQDEKLL